MNNNHTTNLLKKIEIGNPLYNLGLFGLLDKHDACKTDEELVDFYHHLLDAIEGSEVSERIAYSMISYSVGIDNNPLIGLIYEA